MLPPSSRYIPDYIDEAYEVALLSTIDGSTWLGDLRRRVQHYGFRYDYRARRVTVDSCLGPLPDWLAVMADRLRKDGISTSNPTKSSSMNICPAKASLLTLTANRVLAKPSRPSVWARHV